MSVCTTDEGATSDRGHARQPLLGPAVGLPSSTSRYAGPRWSSDSQPLERKSDDLHPPALPEPCEGAWREGALTVRVAHHHHLNSDWLCTGSGQRRSLAR